MKLAKISNVQNEVHSGPLPPLEAPRRSRITVAEATIQRGNTMAPASSPIATMNSRRPAADTAEGGRLRAIDEAAPEPDPTSAAGALWEWRFALLPRPVGTPWARSLSHHRAQSALRLHGEPSPASAEGKASHLIAPHDPYVRLGGGPDARRAAPRRVGRGRSTRSARQPMADSFSARRAFRSVGWVTGAHADRQLTGRRPVQLRAM